MYAPHLFTGMWLAWGAYWLIRSWDVKTTARQEPLLSRLMHLVPLVVAGLLLAARYPSLPVLGDRFVVGGGWAYLTGLVLCAGGLLFAVWARIYLGRNWSAVVTVKQDHELVTGGPYAIVRHPIYTGLLLAFIGSALARGTWAAVLAVVIATLAIWRKLRFEERWMREQFGPAYETYSARVPALVPFIR